MAESELKCPLCREAYIYARTSEVNDYTVLDTEHGVALDQSFGGEITGIRFRCEECKCSWSEIEINDELRFLKEKQNANPGELS